MSGSFAVMKPRPLRAQLEIEVAVDLASERKPEQPVLILERAAVIRRDAAELRRDIPVIRLTRRGDDRRGESNGEESLLHLHDDSWVAGHGSGQSGLSPICCREEAT